MPDPEPSNLIPLILLFSFILSGIFSASEVALLSVSEAKVRTLLTKRSSGSAALNWLKHHPDKLIITILIGNNLVNIAASVLTTVYVSTKYGNQYLGLATGVLTLIVLVFGEILPKTFAQRFSVQFALLIAPLIRFLATILFPLVWIFERFTSTLTVSRQKLISEAEFESEFLSLAEIGEEKGALDKGEKEIIENILEFNETTVEEVMTPRPKIDALNEKTTLDEAITFAINHSHSRIPVFKKTIDTIIGVITIRDLLAYHKKYPGDQKLAKFDLRRPFSLPYTRRISEAFKDFQKNKVQIGIVYDEHGGVEGLITLEDLMEEVFGEIEDETDIAENLIQKVSKNSWNIKGNSTMEEIEERLNLKLDNEDSKSISLLILEKLGRFPNLGEKIDLKYADIYIGKMSGNKIEMVRLIKKV